MATNFDAALAQTITELPEFVNNLLLLLSEKEKTVIVKRFSLNDSPKFTLEQIGKEFSVTRERVRQIEKNALTKMRRNVFNTGLKHLHDTTSQIIRTHGGLIKEDSLITNLTYLLPSGFKFNKYNLHLSFVLHDNFTCVGNTINFFPYIRTETIQDYSLKYASNQLVNQLHKYGNVKKLETIHKDLSNVFTELEFDLIKTRSLIDIDKRITILEDDLVGLLEWKHIHPRTLRDKILYILRKEKKPLHFVKISELIKDADFDNRSVNVQAVHNELIRHDQFILIGRGIYALSEWGYEKGTVSDVIEKILSKKELSQDEIVEKVLKRRQVKKITILLSLKNNEKIQRIGRKRYKLK